MYFSDVTRRHMVSPKNRGAMADASAVGVGGDPGGAFVRLFLKVGEDKAILAAAFETSACPASTAAASLLTETVKGLPLAQAIRIMPEDLDRALGGLPPDKKHCAGLAIQALRQAIVAWANAGTAGVCKPA